MQFIEEMCIDYVNFFSPSSKKPYKFEEETWAISRIEGVLCWHEPVSIHPEHPSNHIATTQKEAFAEQLTLIVNSYIF